MWKLSSKFFTESGCIENSRNLFQLHPPTRQEFDLVFWFPPSFTEWTRRTNGIINQDTEVQMKNAELEKQKAGMKKKEEEFESLNWKV